MIELTKFYYFVFGVLTIAGGIKGFTKGSTISLIAGGISGLLLILAGILIVLGKWQPGLYLGLVVSLLLAGKFAPPFIKTMSFMPAGMMTILSVIGLIVSIIPLIKR